MRIDVVVPVPARLWHSRLITRLAEAGHDVVAVAGTVTRWPASAVATVALERTILRRGESLTRVVPMATAASRQDANLRLDLSGPASGAMSVAFDGSFHDSHVLAVLAAGRLPDITVVLDGKVFDRAAPMVDNRVLVAAATEDVLARAITLALRAVQRFADGAPTDGPFLPRTSDAPFLRGYLGRTIPRIGREIIRRSRDHFAHWRVGYRMLEGPGVAGTGTIGSGWSVLPDDGRHFYADPFPFEHDGIRYIFVEDYPHATGKAVISVSTLDANNVAGPPVPILETPHHLSYPQVFRRGNDIWMLPEASASGKLTLYRAERFPDRWAPAATLIEGEIADATLLRRDDGFWLFATDRDGGLGSTSDTLVVFHAAALTGPWTPHKQNPILIDRRRARPGGAFIEADGRLSLPVQDGTLGYGGGLGLSDLVRLDDENVEFAEPRPIGTAGDFPYPQIHTLNRASRLEVIDGIAAVRRG